MRALLDALTTRGKTFLAVGAAAAAALASILRRGRPVPHRPAADGAPGAVRADHSRARYRLSCTRQLVPRRIQAGQTAEARVRLPNVSRLRTGLLLAEDLTPAAMAGPDRRPRFVLESIEPGGSRDLSHQVKLDQRGKYTIGPLQVRVADAFGLASIGRSFATKSTLVVTPQIIALPRVVDRRQPARRRRERPAYGRGGRRGRHRAPSLPGRRRAAAGALAVHRAVRRADGPARGAALAQPGPAAAGHPAQGPRGQRPGFLLRVCGGRDGLYRRAPGRPGHRDRS